jgi:D-arabinose 5-phosphate isomerase GutQ
MPGDFYAVGNKGFFLRFEVSYMIQKSIKASDIARAFSGGGDTK